MRLLRFNDSDQFELVDFPSNATPPYAILSHTWRTDGGEVLFKDIGGKAAFNKPGYSKLKFCAEKATENGLSYFWIDTCCIDKSSSAELQESITSMFRWYRQAERCYVHLSDVSIDNNGCSPLLRPGWESDFCASRWFTRGWTLQELLAPVSVEFYSKEGNRLGDKRSLEQHIHETSRIPINALRGAPLFDFSIDERMSWASKRQTSRDEDWAYSLLGIFGVVIPLLYGEGKERATLRLRREINETATALATHGLSKLEVANSISPPGSIPIVTASAKLEEGKFNPTYSSPAVVSVNKIQRALNTDSGSDNNDVDGVSARDVGTHDSFQSWIRSFQKQSGSTEPQEEKAAGLARIQQLVQSRKASVHSFKTASNTTSATTSVQVPRSQDPFRRQQFIPPELRWRTRRFLPDDQVHLVIYGLGPQQNETRDQLFPRDGIVDLIFDYLRDEGLGEFSGLEIKNGPKSYVMGRATSKASPIAVEVTEGQTKTMMRNGCFIDVSDRFVDFYNAYISAVPRVRVLACPDCIELVDNRDCDNHIYVDFKRVPRVPDDCGVYDTSLSYASFPLFLARDFTPTLPKAMVHKDGMFFAMLQREALKIVFTTSGDTASQFAIRILTGGVNALTGKTVPEAGSAPIPDRQDYIVVPQQESVSGYQFDGIARQFVAMKMGDKYSVEYQVTGDEFVGGIQLEIIPRLQSAAVFTKHPPRPVVQDTLEEDKARWYGIPKKPVVQDDAEKEEFHLFDSPKKLGLYPGQRVFMVDQRARDLYETHSQKPLPRTNLVEPAISWDDHRMTYIHELYDGPSFERFDLSSSLVVTAIPVIEMRLGPFKSGQRFVFSCSQIAQVKDLWNFVFELLFAQDYNPQLRETRIVIAGKTYHNRTRTLIRDLKLISPQQIGLTFPVMTTVQSLIDPPSNHLIGHASSRPAKVSAGWDMGIAAGGKIKQDIVVDGSPEMWNWKASRTLNIQILNTVAFQAVTGLFPPLSPPDVRHTLAVGMTGLLQPPAVSSSIVKGMDGKRIKSINELDWERGAAPGVVLDGEIVVLCVCCETSICDSLLDACGHMFCGACISYYMSEGSVIKCGFCYQTSTRTLQFGMQATILDCLNGPGEPFGESYQDLNEYSLDAIELRSSDAETTIFQSLITNQWEPEDIRNAIDQPRWDHSPDNNALLQLLLGQIKPQPDILTEINIGRLIARALHVNNKEALQMLIPFYEVVNHPGLDFARKRGINVFDIITGISHNYGYYRNTKATTLVTGVGLEKAQLLVMLGILRYPPGAIPLPTGS